MSDKPLRDKVEFGAQAVTVTLDTEPSEARSNTRDTQWGPKTSYTYFTKEGMVFFATEVLHGKLSQYHKGDTLSVSFAEKRWNVMPVGSGQSTSNPIQSKLYDTETQILLRQIAMDIMEIKKKLFSVGEEEVKYPTDSDLGF